MHAWGGIRFASVNNPNQSFGCDWGKVGIQCTILHIRPNGLKHLQAMLTESVCPKHGVPLIVEALSLVGEGRCHDHQGLGWRVHFGACYGGG